MNLGLFDCFDYFQCPACECLQIVEAPANMLRYYPPDYYSFSRDPARRKGIRKYFRHFRDKYSFSGEGLLGRQLALWFPYRFTGVREWLSITGTATDSRILDVGCGRGELLYDLANAGYSDLVGIDPFLDGDLQYPGGPTIFRKTIHEMEGTFDLIMLHHSLEHVPDPHQVLRSAARLLHGSGTVLVRIPVVPSHAWQHYRENWVQLDAPRHLFLHSVRSVQLLAENAGLQISEVRYDSTEFQFVGSERYTRGIPMSAPGVHFSRSELQRFRRQAEELNARGEGDQAVFYLKKRDAGQRG